MTKCDRCGEEAWEVVPYRRKSPKSAKEVFAADAPLPRAACEILGVEIPWGDHPDDDAYGFACVKCAEEIRR